jgi:2,3-bisphosphoglycerate-independent phosphoglycerate mutase
VKTAHTLNPVRFIIYDPAHRGEYRLRGDLEKKPGLANIAATVMNLLGFEAPADYEPSLIG